MVKLGTQITSVISSLRMDHVALTVPDVDRSIKFFVDGLGMKVLRISVLHPTPDTEFKNAYMYSGTFLLELITSKSSATHQVGPTTWEECMRGSIGITHLGMRVRDLEAAKNRLLAAGAKMIGEPFEVAKDKTNLIYLAEKVDPKIRYARKPGRKAWKNAVFLSPDGIIVELVER